MKLHLGSGPVILPGWVNVDVRPYPGVDRVLDVREGLQFEDVTHIFAEHFIEHFELEDALQIVRECRRVLREDGVLRLTTPNLDWVWATSYSSRWTATSEATAVIDIASWNHDPASARESLTLNRAFRAWGHKFLYNTAILTDLLHRAGFAKIDWCVYGRSAHPELNALEHHELSPDTATLPHILIAEASGRTTYESDVDWRDYLRDLAVD
ncbi:MAG TPA: methyltransferase domain-containing protein [Thermoanaerobaculia bacterium]|jgi:predicted SAM-dependent methyltransferase|nr:methyltransferase domain-containing protein [Thermoanaerobaculia bacterium]